MVTDRDRSRLARDVRTLAAAGKTVSDIARNLDVSRDVVRGICISHGITCVKGRAGKPAVPAAIIPAWVPADLRGGYLACAEIDGEEAAASWARRTKRGGRAMLTSLRCGVITGAQPARITAGDAHRVGGARHPVSQVSGLCLDIAEQGLASVVALVCEGREDRGEEMRFSDRRHLTSSRDCGAPAGLRRDIPAGRRAGRLARGNARGPILFQSSHDGVCQGADARECVSVPFTMGPTGLAGSNRQAAFISARDGASTTIFRREPHHSVSVIASASPVEQKVCAECRTVHPNGRTQSRARS